MSRKASEVLLSLEQEIKKTNQYLTNIDMLLKNLSNRLGALERAVSQPLTEEEQQYFAQPQKAPQKVPQKAPMPGLKSSVIKATDGTLGNVQEEEEVDFPEYNPDDLELENKPIGRRRDARYPSGPSQEKKIPVQQQVLYENNNKNVCQAKVEVFNSNNELVGASKTNNSGKWTQQLIPGRYTISLSKKGTPVHPAVECSYSVDVLAGKKIVPLPPVKV